MCAFLYYSIHIKEIIENLYVISIILAKLKKKRNLTCKEQGYNKTKT